MRALFVDHLVNKQNPASEFLIVQYGMLNTLECNYSLPSACCREVEPIREGKEPREFWDAIGGYEEYATGKRMEVTCNLNDISRQN